LPLVEKDYLTLQFIEEGFEQWEFMQDNAPVHKTKAVLQWFQDIGIPLLDWPPYSLDLNPIENLWSIIKGRLALRVNEHYTQEEFKQMVQEEWDCITIDEINDLINSMASRVKALIIAKGGHTKY
jgi:transposase